MRDLIQDVRYAVRSLLNTPAFAIITVLTLALAIGVNSAIFSMVSVMVLSDMPMQDGDRLGFIFMRNNERGLDRQSISLDDLTAFRDGVSAFEGIAATGWQSVILAGTDEPTRIRIADATANLFDVWRTPVVMGRSFVEGEDLPGAPRVAILSHGTWERRFAADPGVLGRSIKLDGYETTVIGVMTPDLEVGDISLTEMWVPIDLDPAAEGRGVRRLFTLGRLRPGATLVQAEAEVAAVSARLQAEHPDNNLNWTAYVQDFKSGLADSGFWTLLFMLGLTVALVMLIACSNVATMTLARASSRARELALRAALGAGRFRIVRQVLTESAVISIAAGALGLVVARGALTGLTWVSAGNGSLGGFFGNLSIDQNVLLFTLAVALAAPLVFGLVPAWRASRTDLHDALKEDGGKTSGGRGGMRGRRFLVATQVALALTLMVLAGQLIDGMNEIRSVDFGYEPAEILTARLELPEAGYAESAQSAAFFRDLDERLRGLPEIERAVWVSDRPGEWATTDFVIDGRVDDSPDSAPWAGALSVDAGYFEFMRLHVVSGRGFDARDTADGLAAVIVNAEAAERYWDGDPIGQQLRVAGPVSEVAWMQVVGVVSSEVQMDPEKPAMPQLYMPIEQGVRRSRALMVRSRAEFSAVAAAIRREVWAIDPDLPVADIRTLARLLADTMVTMDVVIMMFGAFALFALMMAAGGIYGVLSFAVAQRTREFGIRMALGARGGDVRTMVIRNSALLVGAGLLAGVAGSWLLSRVMASGMNGIDSASVGVYLAVGGVLAAAAGVSAYIPALRATRVDPVIALRAE